MLGIARECGCDWRTAKKRYELQQQIENGLQLPLKQRKSILDPYVDIVNAKLDIAGITASAIYHFLIDTTDYSGINQRKLLYMFLKFLEKLDK